MDRGMVVRLGVLALPLSALVNLATTPGRGEFLLPDEDGFAAWAASGAFEAWASAALNGTVWAIFGFLALGAAMAGAPEKTRMWGTFWSMTGLAVWLPVTGIVAIAWPMAAQASLAGDAGALEVLIAIQEHRTFMVWSVFAPAAFIVGTGLLAWALREWLHGAWLLSFWLGAVGVSLPFWFAVELAGAVLYTAGSGLIAWRVWATPRPTTRPA